MTFIDELLSVSERDGSAIRIHLAGRVSVIQVDQIFASALNVKPELAGKRLTYEVVESAKRQGITHLSVDGISGLIPDAVGQLIILTNALQSCANVTVDIEGH